MAIRKTTAPRGTSRQSAEVASIAGWKKANHPNPSSTIEIPTPQGSLPGDEFHCLHLNSHSLSGYGLNRSARLVCYVTDDVKQDDMAMIEDLDTGDLWAGTVEFDACGFWLNFNSKGRGWQPIYCHRAKTRILGRIIDALDDDLNRVSCSFPFRPIHEQARVFQFKQRA